MPGCVLVRTMGEISEEEMEAAVEGAIELLGRMPGVRWVPSYYSAEEGKMYCGYEAPGVEVASEPVQELETGMFR